MDFPIFELCIRLNVFNVRIFPFCYEMSEEEWSSVCNMTILYVCQAGILCDCFSALCQSNDGMSWASEWVHGSGFVFYFCCVQSDCLSSV